MRTYKCKHCSYEAQGSSPAVLRSHAAEKHPRARKKRQRKAEAEAPTQTWTQQLSGIDPETDAETALLVAAGVLFDETTLDENARGRVINYLAARYVTPPDEG